MEKVAVRSTSSQAKVMGTIVSIAGAFVVTLYQGPPVIIVTPSNLSLHQQPLLQDIKEDSSQYWVLGGLLLTAEYILVPLWYIVLAQIMKVYPNELTVIFFYNLTVSILAAIVAYFSEPNSSAWILKPGIALVSVVCQGVLGSFLNNAVHTWVIRLKGPVYVAMFKPLSIAIAAAMGFLFLGSDLYLGSLIGATIISIGFYTVMWGKAKEDMVEDTEVESLESATTHKAPLLQRYQNEKK